MEKIIETIPYDRVKDYDITSSYFKGKKVCMFDIETTGLSPMYSFTYIIGINVFVDGEWQIIQLFNDDGKSEGEMIREFHSIISDYDILIEFNGDRFDIPYIRKRMDVIQQKLHIHLTDNFSNIIPFDLMKCIKPYKFALGLPNIKQKTIEKYFGIDRLDMYNGGQLIDVYLGYLATRDEKSRKLFLRHNRDDMEGMIFLSQILAIDAIQKGFFEIDNMEMEEHGNRLVFKLYLKLDHPVIKPICTMGSGIDIDIAKDKAVLSIPVYIGELNYFFGEKEKDGADKTSGFFVPLPEASVDSFPLYKEKLRDKTSYIMVNDAFLGDKMKLSEYTALVLNYVMKCKKS